MKINHKNCTIELNKTEMKEVTWWLLASFLLLSSFNPLFCCFIFARGEKLS